MPQSVESATTLRLGQQGRVVIPGALRRALGVEPGDELIAWIEGDRLVLKARDTVERELWEMFANVPKSLAKDLIRERRREAEHERDT